MFSGALIKPPKPKSLESFPCFPVFNSQIEKDRMNTTDTSILDNHTSVATSVADAENGPGIFRGTSAEARMEIGRQALHRAEEVNAGTGTAFGSAPEILRDVLAKYHLMRPLEVDRLCDQQRSSGSGLVAGLIARSSVSVLSGDSGLGKSPLAYQLGLSVATGEPFVEMKTQQGLVVYADFENSIEQSREVREQLVKFLGLSKPPENFILWTPDSGDFLDLDGICQDLRPSLLVVDSLRAHSPSFEKSEYAGEEMKRLNSQARKHGTAILVIHHIKKPGEIGPPLLDNEDTALMAWLKQTAGHSSIINQSHTRMAVDAPDKRKAHSKDAVLLLRWHRRVYGESGPLYLERVCDEDGEPLGYRRLARIELLGNADQELALRALPKDFTFKVAKETINRSDDPTRKWLLKCLSLGLVRQSGKGHYSRIENAPVGGEPAQSK
jgi:hypothetical protein